MLAFGASRWGKTLHRDAFLRERRRGVNRHRALGIRAVTRERDDPVRHVPNAIVVVAIATLLAGGGAWGQSPDKPFSHAIRPRQIAEECFKLPAGETIGYMFEATLPVDFNIHFHRGKDVEYPVKGDQVRDANDRFTAPVTEEFCLMWTNRTLQMVTVKGQLRP